MANTASAATATAPGQLQMQQQPQQQQAGMVRVQDIDYLTEDPPIRGQNYAVVSFLCPEQALRNKECFLMSEFMKAVGDDVRGLLDALADKFAGDADVAQTVRSLRDRHGHLWNAGELQDQLDLFRSVRGPDLEERFREENAFQTDTRGVKVRGVFDNLQQAQDRAKMMFDADKGRGNVFVAQVGMWCPWNPNPDLIRDSKYAVDELNTLMHMYTDNLDRKDQVYEARREERKRLMQQDTQATQAQLARADGVEDEDGKLAYDVWLEQRRQGVRRAGAAAAAEDQKQPAAREAPPVCNPGFVSSGISPEPAAAAVAAASAQNGARDAPAAAKKKTAAKKKEAPKEADKSAASQPAAGTKDAAAAKPARQPRKKASTAAPSAAAATNGGDAKDAGADAAKEQPTPSTVVPEGVDPWMQRKTAGEM